MEHSVMWLMERKPVTRSLTHTHTHARIHESSRALRMERDVSARRYAALTGRCHLCSTLRVLIKTEWREGERDRCHSVPRAARALI